MEPDLTGRCGTCAWFFPLRTREDGIGEGECRLGHWPPPLKETATCANYKALGTSWDNALKRKRAAGTPKKYRDDGPVPVPKKPLPQEIGIDMDQSEFRDVLRQILREELGISDVAMGERWVGGELVMKPGKDETQEKRIPLEQFFSKIVSVRDKLRVLEQKVNTNKKLGSEEKVQLQQYITQCYGSLTTFNVLFRDRADGFTGQSKKE